MPKETPCSKPSSSVQRQLILGSVSSKNISNLAASRQEAIFEMIEKIKPKSIVDMGFGAPTKYIKEFVLKNKTKLVLVDLYESAFEFAKVLFDYLEPSWQDFISFKKLDMNTHEFVGNFDCYIFQDSIEHVKDSTKYLTKTVI